MTDSADPYRDPYTKRPSSWRREWPRGPLGLVETPSPIAVGFCRLCGANARRTTVVRGVFDCPDCFYVWVDRRVGQPIYDIDDFFSDP
jgi:hypothetical protein